MCWLGIIVSVTSGDFSTLESEAVWRAPDGVFRSAAAGAGMTWYAKSAEKVEIADGDVITTDLTLPVWDNR
jgi:hypothetical protein